MAKKPSNQIIDIVSSLPETEEGNDTLFYISGEQRDEIIRLCKQTDKRDQQLRRPRKKAKKATR